MALAKASRRVLNLKQVPSTLLAGYESVVNQDYNIVQNEVNNARMEVNKAAMNAASSNAQFCHGAGCLAKALGQLVSGAAQIAANKSLEEMMTK